MKRLTPQLDESTTNWLPSEASYRDPGRSGLFVVTTRSLASSERSTRSSRLLKARSSHWRAGPSDGEPGARQREEVGTKTPLKLRAGLEHLSLLFNPSRCVEELRPFVWRLEHGS
jgi:hypothetical protein